MSSVVFFSAAKNSYFHSQKNNQFLLCHPILSLLLLAHMSGKNLEELIREIKGRAGTEGRQAEEIDYYFQKFLLLKRSGYLDAVDHGKKYGGRITADAVKSSLASTLQVTFEVTEACNLDCHYCAFGKLYQDHSQRGSWDNSVRQAVQLLDFLQPYWNSSYNIAHEKEIAIGFYGGEPLLNVPFIRKVVDHSKKMLLAHNTFVYTMTTNGVLLDKHIDFLVANGFRLLVSLDGNRENNAYRTLASGAPSFDIVCENARFVQKNYPDYFRKNVNFNAVLHNKNSVKDIHEFFKNEFAKVPSIAEVSAVGLHPDAVADFEQTYRNIGDSLEEASNKDIIEEEFFIKLPPIRSVASILTKFSGYVYKSYADLIAGEEEKNFIPTGTCVPFSRKVFLSSKGKILSCERIGHEHVLGHVREDHVEIDFAGVAELYNCYFDKMRKLCFTCANLANCPVCIYHLDIKAENVTCKNYLSREKYVVNFSQPISQLEKDPGLYGKIKEKYIER